VVCCGKKKMCLSVVVGVGWECYIVEWIWVGGVGVSFKEVVGLMVRGKWEKKGMCWVVGVGESVTLSSGFGSKRLRCHSKKWLD
jgi:hypothetical protein